MSEYFKKGLDLERLIAEIFRNAGYSVNHNVRLTGRSGVIHQIDVYVEYRAPLHLSRIIIECKSQDKPIDKDAVIKLIHEVDDLGVDKGILVTTSYFTSDAISIAKGYNIDLWDYIKLQEIMKKIPSRKIGLLSNVFHIKPNITIETALKIAKKSLEIRHGIPGIYSKFELNILKIKPVEIIEKGSVKETIIVFYPFYELNIDAIIYEKEENSIKRKIINTNIIIEGVKGSLCCYNSKIGVIEKLTLPPLTDEEGITFQILMKGSITVNALASLLSCSTSKARKILQGLVVKGLAEMIRYGSSTLYELRIKIPNILSFSTISSELMLNQGLPKEGFMIEPNLSLREIEKTIKLLWKGNIKEYKILYYPYCACNIIENGKKYVKAVDMISSRICEWISEIFTYLYFQLPFK